MFVLNIVFVSLAISSALGSVAGQRTNSCGVGEFSCSDGTCVAQGLVCDGHRDCSDGTDETICFTSNNEGELLGEPILHRLKRQASRCRRDQWQCRDGTCISFDGKCDGVVDCPDDSDETFALCRKTRCQPNWFRCTYGACVDGTAPCNGKSECADNSDELMPACRNETSEAQGVFKCSDGTSIPASDHCDGTPNCPDGSDETISACAAKICPSYLFQCAYGACVDQGSDCNGKQECADGSDEMDELCNRQLPSGQPTTGPISSGRCVLPPYPEHGTYRVTNAPLARPGQAFGSLQLTVSCNSDYGISGNELVFCQGGTWSTESFPTCKRLCKLDMNPSVQYHCIVSGSITGERACRSHEPVGTVVRPECNKPNYYSAKVLTLMRCTEYGWDYPAVCVPGLPKKGLNITIIINDKVEVNITEFLYASNGNSSDNLPNYMTVNYDTENGKKEVNVSLADTIDTTVNPLYYEISEDDWRMGPVKPVTPINDEISEIDWRMGPIDPPLAKLPDNNNNKVGVNFHIYNSSVTVNSNDKIHSPN